MAWVQQVIELALRDDGTSMATRRRRPTRALGDLRLANLAQSNAPDTVGALSGLRDSAREACELRTVIEAEFACCIHRYAQTPKRSSEINAR